MKGDKLLQQRVAGRHVAGAGTRLDHGGALPVLPHALVVVECGGGRDRDLGGSGIRPQPQVGAKYIAVAGALLHQFHEPLREPHIERRGLNASRQRGHAGVVEDDQIDVARIIELARTHLAHREHDIAAALFGPFRINRMIAPALRGIGQEKAHRRTERSVGEFSQRRCDARHRPDAADIGECDQQRALRFHAPQQPHRLVLGRGNPVRGLDDRRLEAAIGIGFEQGYEPVRLGAHKFPEIGRALGHCRDQRRHFCMSCKQPRQRHARGCTGDLGKPSRDARSPPPPTGRARRRCARQAWPARH